MAIACSGMLARGRQTLAGPPAAARVLHAPTNRVRTLRLQRQLISAVPRRRVAAQAWLGQLLGAPPTTTSTQPPGVEEVSEAELMEILAAARDSQQTLVVVFSATWCGPCKLLQGQLDKTAAKLGQGAVRVLKVDVEENSELASRLKCSKLPTSFFIGPNGTKPAVRVQGLMREAVLEDLILVKGQQHLGSDMDGASLL